MTIAFINLVNRSLPHSYDLHMPCAARYISTKFIFMLIPLISEICYSLKIAAIIMRYTSLFKPTWRKLCICQLQFKVHSLLSYLFLFFCRYLNCNCLLGGYQFNLLLIFLSFLPVLLLLFFSVRYFLSRFCDVLGYVDGFDRVKV